MSVRIIIDSTTDTTDKVRERLSVVPLTVHFDDEEYLDGITITHKQFYEKLVETDVVPHTSQATPSSFLPYFEEVARSGDSAVVITLSSTLSGTYQSAMMAAEEFDNIYVVDSKTASIGGGILAELALRLADGGMSARDIAEKLEQEKEKIRIVALLDTLEYLKRGGRISKTAAVAGGLLNIKPVVALVNGEIIMLGKARGSKQGNNLLVNEIEKAGGVDFFKPVLLGYTGLSDTLMQKYIEDSAELWKYNAAALDNTVIGSVIGTHAGPGAVAVAFFQN